MADICCSVDKRERPRLPGGKARRWSVRGVCVRVCCGQRAGSRSSGGPRRWTPPQGIMGEPGLQPAFPASLAGLALSCFPDPYIALLWGEAGGGNCHLLQAVGVMTGEWFCSAPAAQGGGCARTGRRQGPHQAFLSPASRSSK